jgi:YbgC/YbaW family acyl-CoA thioester hydrolase
MITYRHAVQYYETDKMGITHHANYIRWMEEARVALLAQMGFGYDRLESLGIASPVMALDCRYKAPTTFADVVEIQAGIESFNGELSFFDGTPYLPSYRACVSRHLEIETCLYSLDSVVRCAPIGHNRALKAPLGAEHL